MLRATHESDGYPSNWPPDPAGWLTPAGGLAAWVAVESTSDDAGAETGADEPIVGHVALAAIDAQSLEVARLFTRPAARGGGAGRALLDAAVAHAAAGGRRVELEVDEQGAAVSFYERQGWTRTGRSPASWRRRDGTRPTVVHFVGPTT